MSDTKDNMRIWDTVEKTNPGYTKPVKIGSYNFTAIDAYSQIKQATRLFGPIGTGWGYEYDTQILPNETIAVSLTLWYDSDRTKYVKHWGQCRLFIGQGEKRRPDDDCLKKATTGALTKCLSMLGFNADVFLGKFDDNQYVQQMHDEFNKPAPVAPPVPQKISQADIKNVINLLKPSGLPLDELLKISKITRIEDMPAHKVTRLKKWLLGDDCKEIANKVSIKTDVEVAQQDAINDPQNDPHVRDNKQAMAFAKRNNKPETNHAA